MYGTCPVFIYVKSALRRRTGLISRIHKCRNRVAVVEESWRSGLYTSVPAQICLCVRPRPAHMAWDVICTKWSNSHAVIRAVVGRFSMSSRKQKHDESDSHPSCANELISSNNSGLVQRFSVRTSVPTLLCSVPTLLALPVICLALDAPRWKKISGTGGNRTQSVAWKSIV
jgi:hypothetical protein